MPRYFQLFAAAFFYVMAAHLELAAQQGVSLSLNGAIDMALHHNPDLSVAIANATSADYGIRESKGNFLPKLSLVGSYTRNIDRPVIFLPENLGPGGATEIGSDNNFDTYLDLSVPLYSKYNFSALNYARSYFFWQRENLRGTELAVIANVKKAYYACLLTIEAVQVREKALATAEQNHINITHKFALGVATEYDETAARVRVSNFRNDLLEARNQVVPAENTLKLLLGLPAHTEINLTDSLYLNDEELNAFPDISELTNNSSLRQKELMMQVARQQTGMTKSFYSPTLSGSGMYQYQSQQNDFNFPAYNWVLSSSLGLRLQVPIFNGTVTRNKIQQSVINERIADIQKEFTSRSNDAQFAQLISRLGYLRQRIGEQYENITLAAKAVELIKERYHYGKASLLEVNSAELDYVSARLNYLQSIVEYKSANCDLELLTGK